jgi:hypothetical protein
LLFSAGNDYVEANGLYMLLCNPIPLQDNFAEPF